LKKGKQNQTLNAASGPALRLMPRALLLVIVAAGCMAASAKDSRTSLGVSAIVRAVANVELTSAPADLTVSADDVRRGYVDVLQPTTLVIRSNSASGYVVDLMTVTPMLTSMVVSGFDADLALGAEGGTIVQRWQHPHAVSLSLRFRLMLAPGLVSGRYPWPMRLSVRPLESI
jgi:hypothetical protein